MGVFKTETTITVVLVLNVILLVVVAYFLRTNGDNLYSLEKQIEAQADRILEAIKDVEAVKVVETIREVETIRAAEPAMAAAPVKAAEPGKGAESTEQVGQKNAEEKPVSGVSPQLVAAISAAIAVYLDDQDMEHHTIASIQPTQ